MSSLLSRPAHAFGGDLRRHRVTALELSERHIVPLFLSPGTMTRLQRSMGRMGSPVPCETKMRGLPWSEPSTIKPGENARIRRNKLAVDQAERKGIRRAIGESADRDLAGSTGTVSNTRSRARFRNMTSGPK